MNCLVRVTDSGGTFTATAKIGTGKAHRASATMGREFAARRAAAKAFQCDEDMIRLTPLTPGGQHAFWAAPCVDLNGHKETITWHTEGVPDADSTVLLQSSGGEVGEGFFDGECWRWASGTALVGTQKMKAWAEMPGGVA